MESSPVRGQSFTPVSQPVRACAPQFQETYDKENQGSGREVPWVIFYSGSLQLQTWEARRADTSKEAAIWLTSC